MVLAVRRQFAVPISQFRAFVHVVAFVVRDVKGHVLSDGRKIDFDGLPGASAKDVFVRFERIRNRAFDGRRS